MTKTRPLRILMVDDVEEDLELFRSIFRDTAPDLGFQSAASAERALALLEADGAELPDFILLDLKMPDVDGHDFLAHLKAQPVLKRLPVVILTASEREQDILRAYHGLASAYLIKPTTYATCRAMVEALHNFWQHVRLPRT